MKALSVRQPDASRILNRQKRLEIRTWSTRYRGPLLICAAKRPCPGSLPTGVALCTTRLVHCRPMRPDDEAAACGPFEPGAFAWELADVEPLQELVPVSGRLGLFDVELREPAVS